jgi:exopolyphosphatase/guanosine-5'-triphosphate,3'-diphosphate pyrophosphatase
MEAVAVIDLGTNTFNLVIAKWNGQRYETIFRERAATKIGMGGINRGVITDDGIQRSIHALQKFKELIDEQKVNKVLAFGTSAMRNATNGKEVARQMELQTGFEVRIISGDQEAEYIYKGIREAHVLDQKTSLIVDIGGGSVEFIMGNEDKIFWKQSFEIGAQRLLEQFQKHDPILPDEVTAVRDHLHQKLPALLDQLRRYQPEVLVGSSGTFDTLSEIYCRENNIAYSADDPETPLTLESFRKSFHQLLTKDRADRLLIPGMIEMRVDMIVVACCVIQFFLDSQPFKRLRVSTYSMKEGILSEL